MCYLYFFCLHCFINIHNFDYPDSRLSGLFTQVPPSPDNRGSTVKPFVEELKVLGRDLGYPFKICAGHICLRGALLAVVADTPASNLLGGFKESVGGAKRKYRHCVADFDQIQTIFSEVELELRNQEIHFYHLHQLQDNPALNQHFSKEYGVVRKSVLLDAPYFNVTRQLPQDIMHVLLEGALSRALYFVLHWFLNQCLYPR